MPTICPGSRSLSRAPTCRWRPASMGADSFTINEMTPQDPNLLEVTWSMEGNHCLFNLKPKGYGDTSLFIGVQDSNGVNYGQTFTIRLAPLPEGWALPTVEIEGLNTERQLVVDGSADDFTVPYTLNGAYASLFEAKVEITPVNRFGWDHFINKGNGKYHFDQPGIYPMISRSRRSFFASFGGCLRPAQGDIQPTRIAAAAYSCAAPNAKSQFFGGR